MTRIDNKPGHLIRRCHQITVSLFFDECKDSDLTPMQYSILSILDGVKGIDQTTLGIMASLDKSTAAGTIRRLEAKGLVRRERDLSDRRSILVSLTEKGMETVVRMRDKVENVHTRLMDVLEEHEKPQLIFLLNKIATKLDGHSRVRTLNRTRPRERV